MAGIRNHNRVDNGGDDNSGARHVRRAMTRTDHVLAWMILAVIVAAVVGWAVCENNPEQFKPSINKDMTNK